MSGFTFTVSTTSLAIREYLKRSGEGYAHEFYRQFKPVRPNIQYQTVVHYFYVLRQIGLIERTTRRDGKSRNIQRVYHRVVEEHEHDAGWRNPQKVYTESH